MKKFTINWERLKSYFIIPEPSPYNNKAYALWLSRFKHIGQSEQATHTILMICGSLGHHTCDSWESHAITISGCLLSGEITYEARVRLLMYFYWNKPAQYDTFIAEMHAYCQPGERFYSKEHYDYFLKKTTSKA